MDAKKLNQILLNNITTILSNWLPGGKLTGNEYKCGSVRGEPGNSLSVNILTGIWAEFNGGGNQKGDLIALFAAINGITNGESIKLLSEQYGDYKPTTPAMATVKDKQAKIPAAADSPIPTMICTYKEHNWTGRPTKYWIYRNEKKEMVGIIARYQPTSDRKEILPWVHTDAGWVKGAMDKPRPLYNLPLILSSNKPILIVEGEKCAEAAQELFEDYYTVTTWAGGAEAVKHTDFSPIYSRKIIIWPDNDAGGLKAKDELCSILISQTNDLKTIDPTSLPPKHDIADLINTHSEDDIIKFMRENHTILKPYKLPEIVPSDTEITLTKSSDPQPIYNALAMAAELGLQVDGKQMPVPNSSNVYTILSKSPEFKDICYYDEFKNAYMTTWKTGILRQWTEVEDRQLTTYLQSQYGLPKISKHLVVDALLQYADGNKKNPVKDWLNSLVWDQVPRVSQLFSIYCGSNDSDYSQAISRNFLISIVARVIQPGCKVDTMVILEGAQGINKSTFFKYLASPEYFAESSGDLSSKDFILNCQGKMVIEMAELASLNKKEANLIKNFLTISTDHFRPPYGKSAQAFPRQFIFAGSTNDECYLSDQTGARRFWPISCGYIDIDKLKQDREQLFAEAVHLFKQGATWWEVPESAKKEQDQRRVYDEWETVFTDYFNTPGVYFPAYTTVHKMAWDVLNIEAGRLTDKESSRIKKVLKLLGFKNEPKWVDGKTTRVWTHAAGRIVDDAPKTRKVPVFPFGGEREI